MSSRETAEQIFENFTYRETIRRLADRFRNPDFWRALNPELTISERPFDAPSEAPVIPAGLGEECLEQLVEDGYFVTPPLITSEEAQRFQRGIMRIAAANYPSPLACVYDEYWRLFGGLEALLSPMVGAGYVFVPEGLWSFYVPSGHSGMGAWGPAVPHRDSLGPDPEVLAGRAPSLINLWIPLTDATPLNSCMYVVPAPFDPGFYSAERESGIERIKVQDIRALPARTGSVLGWGTHLLHWGSRSSRRATEPRVSAANYVQRRDVAPFYKDIIERDGVVPFDKRLEWIASSIRTSDLSPSAP